MTSTSMTDFIITSKLGKYLKMLMTLTGKGAFSEVFKVMRKSDK